MSDSEGFLLVAEGLRVDADGAVLLERASFATEARSLVVAGETTGLMSALAGLASIRAGRLELLGRDVAKGEHLGMVGLAPLDPPLPPRWSALEYLSWSARLAGTPKSSAGRMAGEALGTVGASSLAEARLDALGAAERRVLVLAHAIVTMPEVLIAAMPLSGLSGAAAEYVFRAFERATRDRAWIASVSREGEPSFERALADSAEDALFFDAGRLMRAGKLDTSKLARVYALTVRQGAEALRARLAARGIELHGGPSRFFVELPEAATTSELLAASLEAGAPIVQLSPWKQC